MIYSENIKITKEGIKFTDKHGNQLDFLTATKKITNRFYNWWLDAKLYFLHLISNIVPIHSVRNFFFKLAGVKLGRGSVLHMGAKFFDPSGISIGEDTIVGDSCFLDGRSNLTIGDHVDIASEVMIYNSEHDLTNPEFVAKNEPVTIGSYVFIGPRAIILPGVTIADGAVIAAGAVVTKDVGKKEIVAGVPAKKIGMRKIETLNYRLGRARLFQ